MQKIIKTLIYIEILLINWYINIITRVDNKNNKFIIANLMEMNVKYMQNLNMKKRIYIPDGPYRYMISYLSRWLYENIDQLKYIYINNYILLKNI